MKKTANIGKIGVTMLGIAGMFILCVPSNAQNPDKNGDRNKPAGKDTVFLAVTEIISQRKMETKIYPNPVKDMLNLSVQNGANKPFHIQIIDLSGGIILDKNYTPCSDEWMLQVDASKMRNGVYVVRLSCNDEIVSQRLITRE